MSAIDIFVLATFTAPEQIHANPQAMFWLLPLSAAIATVYKATKLPTITTDNFLKETVILFGSIVGFSVITALALFALVWLISL
ncbi:MAG: hypothetical protein PHQ35_04465 [Phycisphaerae bacterium]|nr:hypothetical protein [Phycisphaerae bacterium]MDD5380228.1 hypothetical protein [Phycisphaerae bacterium]